AGRQERPFHGLLALAVPHAGELAGGPLAEHRLAPVECLISAQPDTQYGQAGCDPDGPSPTLERRDADRVEQRLHRWIPVARGDRESAYDRPVQPAVCPRLRRRLAGRTGDNLSDECLDRFGDKRPDAVQGLVECYGEAELIAVRVCGLPA